MIDLMVPFMILILDCSLWRDGELISDVLLGLRMSQRTDDGEHMDGVLPDGERRQHQEHAIGLRWIDGHTVQVARQKANRKKVIQQVIMRGQGIAEGRRLDAIRRMDWVGQALDSNAIYRAG